MKLLKVGVYHHDCWGSFSTKDFPSITMTELGAVQVVKKDDKGVLVNAFFRISADTEDELEKYLKYCSTIKMIKKFKLHHRNNNKAYVFIQWLGESSSYDAVLKADAMPVGPIVQEKEMEVHTVATEDPRQLTHLLEDLESLGEVKVFRISDFNDDQILSSLTVKQQEAILMAFQSDYYKWPRNLSLDDMAKKLGIKRRTFQERLRQAEAKFIPACIEKYVKEKGI